MCKRSNKRTIVILLMIIAIPFLAGIAVWYLAFRSPEPLTIIIDQPKIIAEGFVRDKSSIYMMNFDGSGLQRLFEGSMPDASPDGQLIAYVAVEKGRCLHLFSLDTLEDTCVTSPVSVRNPRWSKDGNYITMTSVFDGVHQVFIINIRDVEHTDDIQIMQRITGEEHGAMYPVFSGDGNYIYYNLPYRHRNLMRINKSGLFEPEPVSETRSDWYSHASIHPGDESIIFSGVRSRRLYYIEQPMVRRETLVSMPVTADPILFPRWIGSERRILFCAQLEREATPQIYVMEFDDRTPVRITDPRTGIRWRSPSVVFSE